MRVSDRIAAPPACHAAADGFVRTGRVSAVSEQRVDVRMPGLRPGALLTAVTAGEPMAAVVRSVSGSTAVCAPLSPWRGIGPGAAVSSDLGTVGRHVGPALLGRVVDAWGRDADGAAHRRARIVERPTSIECGARAPIVDQLVTGVAAIDAFVALGRGQRVALFAGAGVGKSTLLRTIAANCEADARVIALVGERAREAAETIDDLHAGRSFARTTVICATAEASAVQRWAAAETAVAHARALAAGGAHVMLALDSLTRVAQAWRDLASAAGEAPTARGYPASLAAALAGIVEPVGSFARGSVTGVFAVLSEADDRREPVTDIVRALLDGHVDLSRSLAEAGRFPAIDVLRSLSRLMRSLVDDRHMASAAAVRGALSALERADDLLALGAYVPGGDPALDAAVAARDDIERYLHDGGSVSPLDSTRTRLFHIAARLAA